MEILLENGWFPGRDAGLAEFERLILDRGFELNDFARSVLVEFGHLTIFHLESTDSASMDFFHFDVARAFSSADPSWFFEYSEIVGESLCPIGEASRGYLIMGVGPSGATYGGYDDCLVLLGSTPDQAIENLCNNVAPPQPGFLRDLE